MSRRTSFSGRGGYNTSLAEDAKRKFFAYEKQMIEKYRHLLPEKISTDDLLNQLTESEKGCYLTLRIEYGELGAYLYD